MAKTLLHNFLPRWLVELSVKNVYGNPESVTEKTIQRYYELTQREGNRAALAQRFVQTQPGRLANDIPEIDIPVLILWGAKDKLIPVTFAHRFHREIADSELIIFESLGHVPHEEAPQQTIMPVMDFMRGE